MWWHNNTALLPSLLPLSTPQLEDEATRQRHSSMLSLRRCLSICQEKAALFFRKVEIRQTRCEQQIELLSLLEQMWAGKSLRKAVNSRTSSAASGSRGTKRKRVSSGAQQTRSESKVSWNASCGMYLNMSVTAARHLADRHLVL